MVPLNEHESMLDLMKLLALPVLLVSSNTLGTINHTLLSLNCLSQAGLKIAGIIFNTHSSAADSEEEMIRDDNPRIISRFGKVKILGNIRYLGDISANDPRVWERFSLDCPGLTELLED